MLSINAAIGYSTVILELDKEFQSGQIYGIAGENGAGKSTLLRTLAGETFPLKGNVEIAGVEATSIGAVGTAVLIGSPTFYIDMSIGEHLKLLEKTAKLPFEETVRIWDLKRVLDFSPARVSSGQQQRYYLASQLEGRSPKVLLLDEPERHLDRFWVDKLCHVLKQKAAQGIVVILASHSQRILGLCDEIIQLS